MSGVEIVGFILAGLPLVISAAEHYKDGFEPLLKWNRHKRTFRSFINSIDLEKQMFDGTLNRLLLYTDLPLEEKQLLLTVSNYEGWSRKETINALKPRLGKSYQSCIYILDTMKEDMIELQAMMSLKDCSVSVTKAKQTWLAMLIAEYKRLTGLSLEKIDGTIRGREFPSASVKEVLIL